MNNVSQTYNSYDSFFPDTKTVEHLNPFTDFVCQECNSTNYIEDRNTGDLVCAYCGVVASERVISPEAEYRIFSESPSSRKNIRVGAPQYNFLPLRLNSTSKRDRDAHEFLWFGFKNIEEVLYRMQSGLGRNLSVENRAKYLFYKAYQTQVDQKKWY